MMIEDGTGKGNKTKVNDDNQLETFSTCIDVLELLNENSGAVWVLPMDAVAPSGATKFLYLLNNGTSQIGVAAVRMQSTVAGIFRFTKVIGTAAGGTNLTAVSLNLGSPIERLEDSDLQCRPAVVLVGLVGARCIADRSPLALRIFTDHVIELASENACGYRTATSTVQSARTPTIAVLNLVNGSAESW